VVAEIGKTGPRNEPDIAGADYCDAHQGRAIMVNEFDTRKRRSPRKRRLLAEAFSAGDGDRFTRETMLRPIATYTS
jgi:hypothetical protein